MGEDLNKELRLLINQTIKGNRPIAFDIKSTNEELLNELSIYYREIEYQNDELRSAQSALEKVKLDYEELFETAPVGYVIYDDNYVIANCNYRFETLTGKDKNSIIKKKLTSFISEQSQDELYLHVRRLDEANKSTFSELILNHFNEEWFVRVETSLRYKNGKKEYLSAFSDIREQKKAEIAILHSQQDLKTFAQHNEKIKEEERLNFAREIHDELGQILVALKIDIGILKNLIVKKLDGELDTEIVGKFTDLQQLINTTLSSARRIMTDLRPEVVDMLGFSEAVREYLKKFSERYQISCKYINETKSLNLNSQQSLTLYRIVQEAMNNVAKHSHANTVKVSIGIDGGILIMSIEDDGVGFDMKENKHFDSYGLLGIKERLLLIGGEMYIHSEVNKGTQIKINLNLGE